MRKKSKNSEIPAQNASVNGVQQPVDTCKSDAGDLAAVQVLNCGEKLLTIGRTKKQEKTSEQPKGRQAAAEEIKSENV